MPLAAVGGVPLLAGLAGAGELRRRLRVAQRGDRRVLRPQASVQVGHEHIRTGAAPRPTELVPDPAALSQPEEFRGPDLDPFTAIRQSEAHRGALPAVPDTAEALTTNRPRCTSGRLTRDTTTLFADRHGGHTERLMTRGPAPSATSAAPTRSARQRRRARRRNAAAEPLPKVESLGVQARVRRPLPLRPPLLDHLRYAVCCIRGRRGKPSGRRKCRSQDHLDHGPPREHATIWFESRLGTGARSPSVLRRGSVG